MQSVGYDQTHYYTQEIWLGIIAPWTIVSSQGYGYNCFIILPAGILPAAAHISLWMAVLYSCYASLFPWIQIQTH